MSAQEVIKEFQELPPAERAQVVKFVMEQDGSWNAEAVGARLCRRPAAAR